jgi:hypothetical protein
LADLFRCQAPIFARFLAFWRLWAAVNAAAQSAGGWVRFSGSKALGIAVLLLGLDQ